MGNSNAQIFTYDLEGECQQRDSTMCLHKTEETNYKNVFLFGRVKENKDNLQEI